MHTPLSPKMHTTTADANPCRDFTQASHCDVVKTPPHLHGRVDLADLERCGYTALCELGSGAYGVVLKATRIRDRAVVAVKAVNLDAICDIERALIYREIAFLKSVSHPHIVSFIEALHSPANRFVYIVTEYLRGGCLLDRMLRFGSLREDDLIHITRQLLSALSHMHSLRYAHLDLKLENIMLATAPDAPTPVVKLIDFGGVTRTTHAAPLAPGIRLGTLHYAAPQVLTRRPYDPFKADVWSLGVVLYAAATGTFPFDGDGEAALKHAIARKHAPFSEPEWGVAPPAAPVAPAAVSAGGRRWKARSVDGAGRAVAGVGAGRLRAVVGRMLEKDDARRVRLENLRCEFEEMAGERRGRVGAVRRCATGGRLGRMSGWPAWRNGFEA